MAETLQQFKDPNSPTYYGADTATQEGVAFSNEAEAKKYFPGGLIPNAPAPTFDTSKLLATPNQLISFKAEVPKTFPAETTKAAFAPGAPTGADIQTLIGEDQARQDTLLQNITNLLAPTQEEADLTKKLTTFDTATESSVRGLENQGRDKLLGVVRGEQRQLADQRALERTALANTLSSLTATREQKLKAASFLYDATKNRLADTIALYKATAPENLGTKVDEATGQILVFTRNPLTGQTNTQTIGNVKVLKKFYKFDDNDPTVYTRDGQPIRSADEYKALGGNGKWTDVQIVKLPAQNQAEQEIIQKLALEYPDAGITTADNLEKAQAKLQNSKIYKQKTRLSSGGGGGTESERKAVLISTALNAASQELNKSEYYGKDSYIDPGAYLKLRTDYAIAIGDPARFDQVFASKLSPQERARLGVGKATGVNADETGGGDLF